jgi:hypothetical protein
MQRFPIFRIFLAVALLTGLTSLARAHSAAQEMAEAANNFLAALSDEQRAKATFDFKKDERQNWHFIPKDRNGLTLKEMTIPQRHLAYALLNSAMSQRGFMKATTIMSLEQILKELEQGGRMVRDAELYYFSVFGKPGAQDAWGWRVEGHHLSLNFTIAKGHDVAVTPSFFGSNPAEVRIGPRKGLRVLASEEDIARQLVSSLSQEQKKVAIYTNVAPSDIITGTNRSLRVLKPEGLAMGKMTKPQSELLWQLVQEYVRRYRSEVADKDLEKIQNADLQKITFAWAGTTEPGKGHYYRVQGPTFLMEYDNTQNNANHVHAVWRDLQNDFGEDLLRKHYDQDHKK